MKEAREKIKTATHRYAKRQRSWFRKDDRIAWIDANERCCRTWADESLKIIERADTCYKEGC